MELKRLIIETSSRCNLSCTMCIRTAWRDRQADMSPELFQRLLPAFPRLESISLTGYGEPLLNPYLPEMALQARACLPSWGVVGLTTNGTRLDTDMARELVKVGLDYIVISMDGTSPRVFNGIRLGTTLETVVEGIRQVQLAKERLGSRKPRLGIEFVAMKNNIRELPSLVSLARGCQVNFIMVTHLLPHTEALQEQALYDSNSDLCVELFDLAKQEAATGGFELTVYPEFVPYIYGLFGVPPIKGYMGHRFYQLQSNKPREQTLRLLGQLAARAVSQGIVLNFSQLLKRDIQSLAEVYHVFDQAQREAEKSGIELNLPPLQPRARRECGFVKTGTAFVSWDGVMRPCLNLSHAYTCYLNGRRKSVNTRDFGRVMEHDPTTIWSAPEYALFRHRLEEFSFPPCGDCNFNQACSLVTADNFEKDCYFNDQPCGDCPWSRGLLQCP